MADPSAPRSAPGWVQTEVISQQENVSQYIAVLYPSIIFITTWNKWGPHTGAMSILKSLLSISIETFTKK